MRLLAAEVIVVEGALPDDPISRCLDVVSRVGLLWEVGDFLLAGISSAREGGMKES